MILEELLSTPPEYCNTANLVCALTYSVKIMGQQQHLHYQPDVSLRTALYKVFDVVHTLLHCEDE